jgi:hypothetical protein
MKIEEVAMICHEANRAYCWTIGDFSQAAWDQAPEWQRDSAIKGVVFHLSRDVKPVPPRASHESWLKEKQDDGWKYGPVKDAELKEHPCMVDFEDLPRAQQAKDYLFGAIVEGLRRFVEEEPPLAEQYSYTVGPE